MTKLDFPISFPTATPSGVPYAIACAYFGGLDPEHHQAVLALEYGEPRVRVMRTHGVPYIDQARALLAAAALRELPDDGVLMMLDHDIIFHPSDVVRLVEECATGAYDVVGVPYSMRKEGGSVIGFFAPPTLGEEWSIGFYARGGLYPAFGMGMGFTAIRMRVIRALADSMQRVRCGTNALAWPMFALEVQADHSVLPNGEKVGFYHGEDVSFCRRASAAGFKLGLDTRPRIGHKGTKIYAIEDTAFMVPLARDLTLKLVAEKPGEDNPHNPFVRAAPQAQR
jgi:hypothetical protein